MISIRDILRYLTERIAAAWRRLGGSNAVRCRWRQAVHGPTIVRNRFGSRDMSNSDHNSPGFCAQHKQWIAAWLIFLAVIFGFGWFKAQENDRDLAARVHWSIHLEEMVKSDRTTINRVRTLLHALHGKSGSQQQLERDINAGEPFNLQQNGDRDVTEWTDRNHAVGLHLEFRDGVLMGWNMNSGSRQIYEYVLHPPESTAQSGNAEFLRRRIAIAGVYAWLAAFVAWFVVSRRRLLAAQVLLAAALASGMAWLVNPGYTISRRGVFSNDNLAIAALMIVISVYLLAVTLSVHSNTELEILRFRFRTRQLLLAVTVAAILLAAGPFGFVVLIVAVAGTVLFALVYHHYRSRLESAA